jgi:hypothetical protein
VFGQTVGNFGVSGVPSVLSTGSTTPRGLPGRFADTLNALDYLPFGQPDGATDNTTALQALITSTPVGSTIYFPKGIYATTGLTWKSGVNARFDSVTIKFLGATGNIIQIATNATNIQFTGALTLLSDSPGVSNSVYGIYALGVSNFSFDTLYLSAIAMGMWLQGCTDIKGNNLQGASLLGVYHVADGGGEAGDLLALGGCSRVAVNQVVGNQVGAGKATVYLGVVSAYPTDNTSILIGSINTIINPATSHGSALAIRSGNGVTVNSVTTVNGYRAVMMQNEATDAGFSIQNVSIGSIVGQNLSATNGVGLIIDSLIAGSQPTNITINSVNINTANLDCVDLWQSLNVAIGNIVCTGTFGGRGLDVYQAVDTHIGGIVAKGATTQNVSFRFTSDLVIGRILSDGNAGGDAIRFDTCTNCSVSGIESKNAAAQGVWLYQNNLSVVISSIYVVNACRVTAGVDAVRVDVGSASTGNSINSILARTTTGNAHARVLDVVSAGSSTITIGSTVSIGGSNDPTSVIFNSSTSSDLISGHLRRSTAPTLGAWVVGDYVEHNAPTVGGPIGWVNTTAGSPGVWTPVNPPGLIGSVALVAGTKTVTVRGNATCFCTDQTAVAAVQCGVTTTTLTINGTGTDIIAYVCY